MLDKLTQIKHYTHDVISWPKLRNKEIKKILAGIDLLGRYILKQIWIGLL